MGESEEEFDAHLMKVKETSANAGLKFNIINTRIMASGTITPCQIDRAEIEVVTDFICLVFNMSSDVDCSHGIKRQLLLRRKSMTNLNSIFKSIDIISSAKYPNDETYGVLGGNVDASWALRNSERRRVDTFEL